MNEDFMYHIKSTIVVVLSFFVLAMPITWAQTNETQFTFVKTTGPDSSYLTFDKVTVHGMEAKQSGDSLSISPKQDSGKLAFSIKFKNKEAQCESDALLFDLVLFNGFVSVMDKDMYPNAKFVKFNCPSPLTKAPEVSVLIRGDNRKPSKGFIIDLAPK